MRVVVVSLVLALAAPVHAQQMVRIAVGRFTETVTVSGPGVVVSGADGRVLKHGGPVVLAAGAKGLRLAGKPLDDEVVRLRSDGELVVRGHRYRNLLEVSWRSLKGRVELLVVHPLPLETYVAGIVASELPRDWPDEALAAQAIAARTYAVWQKYRRLDLPYHMESTVLDQVYHGAEREHAGAIRAATSTAGLILTSHRRPVQAYFHASCGDVTESAHEGWGTDLEYLPGGRCGFCSAATRYRWRVEVPKNDVDRAFRPLLGEPVERVVVKSKTKSGRAKQVELVGANRKKTIAAADVRRLLGYSRVWSTMFTKVELTPSMLVVEGRGAGHGVGMCQWGARGMALAGKSHSDILAHYYPTAAVSRLY